MNERMDTGEKQTRKNPAETANLLSLLFFGWTLPIFWRGSKHELHLTDLFDPLKSHRSELLGNRLEREWKKDLAKADQAGKDGEKKPVRRPHLIWAIIRAFWVPCMVQGLFTFIHSTVLYLMQPVLQGLVIRYFDPGQNLMTWNQVVMYAGLLVIVILASSFMFHHTTLHFFQTGMCIRIACCSIIYRKILRLNQATINNKAAGQVANLISNDVARFDKILTYIHFIWIMPIQVLLTGFMMWHSVGVAALVGIGSILFQSVTIQGCISRLITKFRAKIAAKTDERAQWMSELLSGIQVVKMYSWEKPFNLLLSKVRTLEMKFIAYNSYLRGINIGIFTLSEQVSLYFTLITFVLMGNDLTADITFTLIGLFAGLKRTCAINFPQAISNVGEAGVSLRRITKFLLLDEVECPEKVQFTGENGPPDVKPREKDQKISGQVGIEIIKVTASWIRGQILPTLCGVSVRIRSQKLCALVGPVGSGKSSLLHLVLGELPIQTGKLSFSTDEAIKTEMTIRDIRVSYASQDAWLFPATIRDNILFDQPYDEKRYKEVTRVCTLLKDFEQLPQGDLTFTGERGVVLSGGQKARINLARAVYRDADLYLLDDPLSAVDPRVGRHLFEQCINGFLKGKTRILVTHQLQNLRQADTVIILNRGIVEFQGTYDELVRENFDILESGDFEELDKVEHAEENHFQDTNLKMTEGNEGSRVISGEEKATGNISKQVYLDYLLAGGNVYWLALLVVISIAGQVAISGIDYWVSYWSSQETLRATLQLSKSDADNTSSRSNAVNKFHQTHSTESQWFDKNGLMSPNLGIYIYTACLISGILLTTLRNMLFMNISINASRKIHELMLTNLLQATMEFFTTNPSGRILNRFTKDVGAMDQLLPTTMLNALRVFTIILGIFILVTLANNWMILPIVALCGVFYIIRNHCFQTLRDAKRLEGITKSPMFSHVSVTLDGITTIRSRGVLAVGLLQKEFDGHQDIHTGASYLSIATSTALAFITELIACCFIACVCFSFILLDAGDTLGGIVGLAISQSLILIGNMQYGVRQSTELVAEMTSVERTLQYTNLPEEGPFATDNPIPPTWPSKGCLVFKDVSLRYANHKPLVLKNLNMAINSGWKIGIVGRTGSGKSSLVSTLFRLTGDGLEGEIIVDGIDTKSIGLHELRPRISIIPQEPILFSTSLRYNLDPFEQYSDAELWNSLREVELANVVPSLDFQVAGGGANFSVGQRQLICLARAILKSNRILVLDEATANVDHCTDALIQRAIRRRFTDCTVLTISHRMNTIMDSDRVVVMRNGCIVEFDHPHLLLQNPDSLFSKMLQQTGTTVAPKLAEIAKSAFLLRPELKRE